MWQNVAGGFNRTCITTGGKKTRGVARCIGRAASDVHGVEAVGFVTTRNIDKLTGELTQVVAVFIVSIVSVTYLRLCLFIFRSV